MQYCSLPIPASSWGYLLARVPGLRKHAAAWLLGKGEEMSDRTQAEIDLLRAAVERFLQRAVTDGYTREEAWRLVKALIQKESVRYRRSQFKVVR